MRLVRLRAHGFKRLLDVDLDLGHDRLLVIGANEAGKSTLMEALMAGLYGLAPTRRGSGHTAALRQVLPWTGRPAGLSLTFDLDDGRRVEADWNLSGQRTRVIDHSAGEDISASFATGTHGWLDLGESLLGLPARVFAQVTCLAEGELAQITDEVQVRQSLQRVADSGVDVLVEEAVRRLDVASRQASIPKVNAATRRNEVAQQLLLAETQLTAAQQARLALEEEVLAIDKTETELEGVRVLTEAVTAEQRARQAARTRLAGEIERARGRLIEAESRLASLHPGVRRPGSNRPEWTDVDLERARQALIAGVGAAERSGPPLTALAIGGGVGALVIGILLRLLLFEGLGAVLIALGVYLATRGGRGTGVAGLEVGGRRFASRPELMSAIEEERSRREYAGQLAAVAGLRQQLEQLLEQSSQAAAGDLPMAPATPAAELPDAELERRAKAAEERRRRLEIDLARQLASLERGARGVPEVSPLEERVQALRQQAAHLDAFGVACRLAAVSLAEASEEIRRAYAPRLQSHLERNLARVTRGRYVEALVDDRFEVLLRAPETSSMVDLHELSRGTQQQVYLLLRLGLLDVMGGRGETLPLFLDDALALADDQRRADLLKVLEGERRQVIYLTGGESAAAGFGPSWRRLVLPPPSAGQVDRAAAGPAPVSVVVNRSA